MTDISKDEGEVIDQLRKALIGVKTFETALVEVQSMTVQTKQHVADIANRVASVERRVDREIIESQKQFIQTRADLKDLRDDMLTKDAFQTLINKASWRAITIITTAFAGLLIFNLTFVWDHVTR